MKQLGQGCYRDELKVGGRFRNWGPAITGRDIVSFVKPPACRKCYLKGWKLL